MRLTRAAMIALALASACASSPDPAARLPSNAGGASQDDHDPAGVEGVWQYETTSNCGTIARGRVELSWNDELDAYEERGRLRWDHSNTVIEWWGTAHHDSERNTLSSRLENSLGDHVSGEWRLEGDKMITDWSQTNGCHGRGIATR